MTPPAGTDVAKPAMRPSAVATRVRRSSPPRPGNSSASGLASRFSRSPSLDSDAYRYTSRSAARSAGTASRITKVTGSGTEREQAAVPVRLDPRPATAPQPDLQHVGLDPAGSPEPQLEPGRGNLGEARQAGGRLGRRVHIGGRPGTAHARVRRPHPQPPAVG